MFGRMKLAEMYFERFGPVNKAKLEEWLGVDDGNAVLRGCLQVLAGEERMAMEVAMREKPGSEERNEAVSMAKAFADAAETILEIVTVGRKKRMGQG